MWWLHVCKFFCPVAIQALDANTILFCMLILHDFLQIHFMIEIWTVVELITPCKHYTGKMRREFVIFKVYIVRFILYNYMSWNKYCGKMCVRIWKLHCIGWNFLLTCATLHSYKVSFYFNLEVNNSKFHKIRS